MAVAAVAHMTPVHHKRGGFRNAEPTSHGSLGVMAPFFARRIWSNLVGRGGAAARVPNDGVFLRHNARHSVPTVTWIGHSTVLVQMWSCTQLWATRRPV